MSMEQDMETMKENVGRIFQRLDDQGQAVAVLTERSQHTVDKMDKLVDVVSSHMEKEEAQRDRDHAFKRGWMVRGVVALISSVVGLLGYIWQLQITMGAI